MHQQVPQAFCDDRQKKTPIDIKQKYGYIIEMKLLRTANAETHDEHG